MASVQTDLIREGLEMFCVCWFEELHTNHFSTHNLVYQTVEYQICGLVHHKNKKKCCHAHHRWSGTIFSCWKWSGFRTAITWIHNQIISSDLVPISLYLFRKKILTMVLLCNLGSSNPLNQKQYLQSWYHCVSI